VDELEFAVRSIGNWVVVWGSEATLPELLESKVEAGSHQPGNEDLGFQLAHF